MMEKLTADTLALGDKITQDGLMVCEVVGFDGSLGRKEGLVEIEYEGHDGTKTGVKTDRELSHYFTRCE
jgi:hypothetical protein